MHTIADIPRFVDQSGLDDPDDRNAWRLWRAPFHNPHRAWIRCRPAHCTGPQWEFTKILVKVFSPAQVYETLARDRRELAIELCLAELGLVEDLATPIAKMTAWQTAPETPTSPVRSRMAGVLAYLSCPVNTRHCNTVEPDGATTTFSALRAGPTCVKQLDAREGRARELRELAAALCLKEAGAPPDASGAIALAAAWLL